MNKPKAETLTHEHCYHPRRGPIHMLVPDGHVVEQCCSCGKVRTVHAAHRDSWT